MENMAVIITLSFIYNEKVSFAFSSTLVSTGQLHYGIH